MDIKPTIKENTFEQLNLSEELRKNLQNIKNWYGLSDDYIITRALEKYWVHHRNKVEMKDIKKRQFRQLLQFQLGKCYYCGRRISSSTATLDHKVPTILGGETTLGNLCAACDSCNFRKGDLMEEEFMILLKK